jgi:hypothetical protein
MRDVAAAGRLARSSQPSSLPNRLGCVHRPAARVQCRIRTHVPLGHDAQAIPGLVLGRLELQGAVHSAPVLNNSKRWWCGVAELPPYSAYDQGSRSGRHGFFDRNRAMLLGSLIGLMVVTSLCWLLFTTPPVNTHSPTPPPPPLPPPPPSTVLQPPAPVVAASPPPRLVGADECSHLESAGCTWRNGFKCDGGCAHTHPHTRLSSATSMRHIHNHSAPGGSAAQGAGVP